MGRHEGTSGVFWVYRRGDGYLGVIQAANEKLAQTMLNVLPQGYEILTTYTDMTEAREATQ